MLSIPLNPSSCWLNLPNIIKPAFKQEVCKQGAGIGSQVLSKAESKFEIYIHINLIDAQDLDTYGFQKMVSRLTSQG